MRRYEEKTCEKVPGGRGFFSGMGKLLNYRVRWRGGEIKKMIGGWRGKKYCLEGRRKLCT